MRVDCVGEGKYNGAENKTIERMVMRMLESQNMEWKREWGTAWDSCPLVDFTMADVDEEAVGKFRKMAAKKGRLEANLLEERKEVLMEKLHLTNGDYLTNAAMLLFSKDPERYLTGAYIKIGYFENDAELLYQDEIHGPILEQVDRALEVIYLKYMRAKIWYEGIQRIERYFVPKEALREALLNAICHKDYQSGVPIQVSVYEDRLYVSNVGRLTENWTLENLMQKHPSRPFNPNIAHVFYLAGFIESWGRGVEKICNALVEDNLPLPEYTIHPSDIMIKFTAPEDRIVRMPKRASESLADTPDGGVPEKLSEKEKQAVDLAVQEVLERLARRGVVS